MSKKEIYAWSSLATSLALLGYYLVAVFGWPQTVEPYSDHITSIFWQVFVIAFVVELVLELLRHFNVGEVQEDERDAMLESKGYRNAYYVLMVTLVALIANSLVSDVIEQASGEAFFLSSPFMTFHLLVALLFAAHITKYGTQIYYYQKY